MAVTNETSTEFNQATDPRTYGKMDPDVTPQKAKIARFNFTQSAAAGDIASTQKLLFLPPGRIIVFPKLSFIQWTAFGAARVLDIGYAAYTGEDGVAVGALANAFDDDIDVSAAGGAAMGSDLTVGTGMLWTFKSSGGVTLLSTVAGGTIPAAATLKGYVTYAEVGQ